MSNSRKTYKNTTLAHQVPVEIHRFNGARFIHEQIFFFSFINSCAIFQYLDIFNAGQMWFKKKGTIKLLHNNAMPNKRQTEQ